MSITAVEIDNSVDQPLSHARIGYENLLIATTQAFDFPKMLTPNTYERMVITGANPTISKFQLAEKADIDFIGIAAHNISDIADIEFTFYYSVTIGGPLIEIDVIASEDLTDNSAIMLLFDTVSAAEVTIEMLSASYVGLEIGVFSAGKTLQMQRPIYGGHAPMDLAANTKYQNTMSDSGQFLGRDIVRKGTKTKFSWRHLDPDWLREHFKPFMDSAKTTPFFIQWRPELYDAAIYGFTTKDIKPMNMGGGHNLMSVSFDMQGHADT